MAQVSMNLADLTNPDPGPQADSSNWSLREFLGAGTVAVSGCEPRAYLEPQAPVLRRIRLAQRHEELLLALHGL